MEIKKRKRKGKKDRSGWTAMTNSEILSTMEFWYPAGHFWQMESASRYNCLLFGIFFSAV